MEGERRRAALQAHLVQGRKRAVDVGWVTVPTCLPPAKFWDGLLPEMNLITCWLKFLCVTVERFSYEELSSQTKLCFHMDEL